MTAGETREWDARLALERTSENVIVSDSASPALATNTPDLVDVITREQIDQRQEIWLTDMLASQEGRAFRGWVVRRDHVVFYGWRKFELHQGADRRGTGERAGRRVRLFEFYNDNIDKIEIVHGATSALYGSDAMDGVIQIFTHRGTSMVPQVTLEGDGGTFGTGHGSAAVSGMAGKFDYSAAGDYFSTDGQGPGNYFRDVTASGNFGYRFSDTDTLSLRYGTTSATRVSRGQTLLPGGATPGASSDIHDFDANLAWNFSVGPHWQNRVSAFESRFFLVENSPPFGSFTSDYNRAGGALQSTYLFKNGSFTTGYENENEIGPSASRHNQAGYIEARYQFGTRLTAIVGGRVEDNGFFGTRTVPRVGASYALHEGADFRSDAAARIVWRRDQGTANSPAGLRDAVETGARHDGGGGNRSVLRGRSCEIVGDVLSQRFPRHHELCVRRGVAKLSRVWRQLLQYGQGAGGGSEFVIRSEGGAPAEHFEITATTIPKCGGAECVRPGVGPPATGCFKRPLHLANLVANAHFLRMNWNIAGFYVGRRTDSDFLGLGYTSDPSYVRWDLSNSVDLGHGFSTVAHFVNLFDRHYQEAIGIRR